MAQKIQTLSALQSHMDALPPVAEVRMAALIDFLTKPIDDLIHSVGGIDKFCEELDKLYDKYIAPENVPWVPDALEPALVDGPLKALIKASARRFHEVIHKVPPVTL